MYVPEVNQHQTAGEAMPVTLVNPNTSVFQLDISTSEGFLKGYAEFIKDARGNWNAGRWVPDVTHHKYLIWRRDTPIPRPPFIDE